MTNSGRIGCDGRCSVSIPSNSLCPPPESPPAVPDVLTQPHSIMIQLPRVTMVHASILREMAMGTAMEMVTLQTRQLVKTSP